MAIERGNHNDISPDQITSSIDLALAKGLMNSFVLKGPIGEVIITHYAVALRGLSDLQSEFIILVDEDAGYTRDDVDNKLGGLKTPSHLMNGHSPLKDKELSDRTIGLLVKENTPFVMLEVGESEYTEQEMIVLSAAKGMTIETAITSLQIMNNASKENNKQI